MLFGRLAEDILGGGGQAREKREEWSFSGELRRKSEKRKKRELEKRSQRGESHFQVMKDREGIFLGGAA